MQSILTWDGIESHILSGPYRFITDEKPNLSFYFKSLYYEPDAGNSFLVTPDGESQLLTDEQVAECNEFAREWWKTHDYPVQCYIEPYCLYEGEFPKSRADELGYSYTVNEHPDHPASKFVNGTWERLAMVVLDNGSIMENPGSICEHCVAGFTASEMNDIPARPNPFYGWDIATWTWKDFRSLDQAKIDAATSVRADFEMVRYERSADHYYTPAYETETWTWQVHEAEAWLADEDSPTPYIDTFLSARTDEGKPTKRELCEDILNNHEQFLVAMAQVNGAQWGFLSRIKAAEDNDTCVAIMDEAKSFCTTMISDSAEE